VDHSDLASRWIALQFTDRDAPDYKEHFRAFEEVDALTDKYPEDAWNFVLAVLIRSESDFIVANLAAGPVEDLLMRHPEETVRRIERDVPAKPALARMLHGVWQNDLSPDLWARITLARESQGSVA
jgi:hypothetical protein